METAIRPPAVAGRFYSRDPLALREEVEGYLGPGAQPRPALGCIVPHAGYMYSGPVAGAVFRTLEIPPTCVILCPNHTGLGVPISIMSNHAWQTPLGALPVDVELASRLKDNFAWLEEDAEAHRAEHAVEVQLPFLQVLRPSTSFVPIVLGTREFSVLEALGAALAQTIAQQAHPVLIIASSDMNHYESDLVTRRKDHLAIERILELDARGLFDVAIKEDISMCGLGPAVTMLTAARLLGARSAERIQYATSGDVSGDRRMVVGYAGMVIL
jgi:AmmeMemoRadiSam system protein B